MRKNDFYLLLLLALLVLSINFIYQKNPGYMDSEYYYLGGKQLSEGQTSLNVIWNFLDDPSGFPHPLFSYWLPLASIISSFSMDIFGSTFTGSRVIFWILAAGLAPLTYFVSFRISQNRFVSVLAGLFAIFSGYLFKFLTIPETIVPGILIGGAFFLLLGSALDDKNTKIYSYILIGLFAGLLYLNRADGVVYILIAISCFSIYILKQNKNFLNKRIILNSVLIISTFLTVIIGLFIYNKSQFGSFFSPATSKVIWIATYDDTFSYPAAILTPKYFLENGLSLRFNQVIDAIKQNSSSFLGVQLIIIGLPLFIIGIKRNIKKTIIRVAIIHLIFVFLIMSIIFPLAGARGGFLHSSAGNQIIVWYLMADGLQGFIEWGINKRNWKLIRSQRMFGSSVVLFAFLITGIVYYKDVMGNALGYKWNVEYEEYKNIENIVLDYSKGKSEVVMINNPIGYYYATGRRSVVIPNSTPDDLLELWGNLDVKYLVIDSNLPEKFTNDHLELIDQNFELIGENGQIRRIYKRK